MSPHSSEQSALLRSTNNSSGSAGDSAAPKNDARTAFDEKNMQASRQYHDARRSTGDSLNGGPNQEVAGASEEGHQSEGGLLKPIIFGGLDGILTSFAIVAGAAGGGLSPSVVLVLGFSNIFADALRWVV